MAQTLKNPPVYYTLAQVKFNPVLTVDDRLPSIQEGMRKLGYPDFEKVETQVFKVSDDGKTPPQAELYRQYLFHNINKNHGFALSGESLIFQSSEYSGFKVFSEQLFSGLRLINEHLELDYVDRAGLRFLNDIRPEDGEELDPYLHDRSHGLADVLGGDTYHSFVENFGHIDGVDIKVRTMIQIGGLGFPPDIIPHGMKMQKRFVKPQSLHAILDIDCFNAKRQAFKLDQLEMDVERIHATIETAFLKVVTEHALQRWDE